MPYTDPFRLRVLKNLSALFETITPANGFNFDMTGAVFRGRDAFGTEAPTPMISILESAIPLDQLRSPEGSIASSGEWPLDIQGWCEDDKKNPTDPAHHLLAAMKKVLIVERKKLQTRDRNLLGMEGAVEDIIIGAGIVRPPDEISAKAYCWLPLNLKLVEDLEAPYS